MEEAGDGTREIGQGRAGLVVWCTGWVDSPQGCMGFLCVCLCLFIFLRDWPTFYIFNILESSNWIVDGVKQDIELNRLV